MKQLVLLTCLVLFAFPIAADPGIKDREIILGSHQPLTGIAKQFADISKSTEAYFRYINDQGGIHGRLLSYRYLDDQFNPIKTKEVIQQLILEEQVFLILNGLGTATHRAVSPWLKSLKIPDFFVGSEDPQWAEPLEETVFGFHPTPRVEGRVLAKQITQKHLGESVLIWHDDTASMKEVKKYLAEYLQSQGMNTHSLELASSSFTPIGTNEVNEINEINPSVIVLLTTQHLAVQMLETISQYFETDIYLGYALADSRLLASINQEVIENSYMLTAFPLSSQIQHPGIKLHRRILQEYAPGLSINRWTIYGQAVGELMAEVLYRSGRQISRYNVVKAAEKLTLWQGSLTPPISLSSENHQPINHLRIVQFKEGQFEYVSDWIDAE